METRHLKGKLYLSVLIFLMLLNFTVADSRSHVPARVLAKQTGATQFEEERYEAHADCNDHKHHLKKRASDEDVDYEVYQGVVGRPGIDFPIYPHIPKTSFSCRSYGNGYFADMETDCQVFHICEEGRKISFLCPNGTIFQQSELTCDWWFKVNCLGSSGFYADSTELLNKQRVEHLKPSIPVQGFNIVGGGLNIKPRVPAKPTPRARGGNVNVAISKPDRRIDSAEAPSLESVDFDDLSGEKQIRGSTKTEITTIDNNDNDELQIPAESASFVTNRNRNSYNNEKHKLEHKVDQGLKVSSLKTEDGSRRGAGDRGSQRRGYGGLNTETTEKPRSGQRGNQRYREGEGKSRTNSEEKPFKKDKVVENVDKLTHSTPSYVSGTYTTARRLDSTRTTPFYTPTVPSVSKSKNTEGKSNYGSSKAGSPTTPTPHRFSIGNNNPGIFLESSGSLKPTVSPNDVEITASNTVRAVTIGTRRHNTENNDRSSEFQTGKSTSNLEFPLPSNHKNYESEEIIGTTPAPTGPTYLPKSASRPKSIHGSSEDSFLFAPTTVVQEEVNRNVHDMIKTMNVLQHNFEDVELVKFNGNGNGNGNTRLGLDIPPSSGPDALFSLAKYFATEEPGSANKNVNSLGKKSEKNSETKTGNGSGSSSGANGGGNGSGGDGGGTGLGGKSSGGKGFRGNGSGGKASGNNGSRGNGSGGNSSGGYGPQGKDSEGNGFGGSGSGSSGLGGNGSGANGLGSNGSGGHGSGGNGSGGKGSGGNSSGGNGSGGYGSGGNDSRGNGSGGNGYGSNGSGVGDNGVGSNGSGGHGSGGNGLGDNGSGGGGSGGSGSGGNGLGGNGSGGKGSGGNGSGGYGSGGNDSRGNGSGGKGYGSNGSGFGDNGVGSDGSGGHGSGGHGSGGNGLGHIGSGGGGSGGSGSGGKGLGGNGSQGNGSGGKGSGGNGSGGYGSGGNDSRGNGSGGNGYGSNGSGFGDNGVGSNGSGGHGSGGNGLGHNGSGGGGSGGSGSGSNGSRGNGSGGNGYGSNGSGFGDNGVGSNGSGGHGSGGNGLGHNGSGGGGSGGSGSGSNGSRGNGSGGNGYGSNGSGFGDKGAGSNGSGGHGSGGNGVGHNGSGGGGSEGSGSGGNGLGGNDSQGNGSGGSGSGVKGSGGNRTGSNRSGGKNSDGNNSADNGLSKTNANNSGPNGASKSHSISSGNIASVSTHSTNSKAPKEKPSDTTATLTTETPAALAHNADHISSSLLSNNTVTKYNTLFGLNAPTGSSSEANLRNGLADPNAPKSRDINTPFPQIGPTDATIQALAEKPESRKIAQVFSNALNNYLNDPVKFRDELQAVRPTEPPGEKKFNFVSVTDPTLFKEGTAATYLPTAPPATNRPISTTHPNIASVINSNLITSTGYPDLSSTTEVFDITTFKQSSGEQKHSLEFSGELEPPGADSGEELLQREHTQSFVNSRNGLLRSQEKSGKLSIGKPDKPWSFTEDDGVLDPLKINDGLMKKHQSTVTSKSTIPSPIKLLTGETTTNVPKHPVKSHSNNLNGYQPRGNSNSRQQSEGKQHNARLRSETDDPWADIFDSYDLPKESLPTNSGLQRIANKLFGGLNENEALHLKNVMAEAEHNRQILRLLLLLIQTCDDNNGKALERSRKSLLNALISMDTKVTKDNAKNAHVKDKPLTTTEKLPVTTYRRTGSGEEITTSTLTYSTTTTDVPSTTIYGSTTDANNSGETTKFAIIVDDDESSTTTKSTSSAGSGTGGQLEGSSDKRALELLKSLYSLASKFTSRR